MVVGRVQRGGAGLIDRADAAVRWVMRCQKIGISMFLSSVVDL